MDGKFGTYLVRQFCPPSRPVTPKTPISRFTIALPPEGEVSGDIDSCQQARRGRIRKGSDSRHRFAKVWACIVPKLRSVAQYPLPGGLGQAQSNRREGAAADMISLPFPSIACSLENKQLLGTTQFGSCAGVRLLAR